MRAFNTDYWLKIKLNRFKAKMESVDTLDDEFIAIRPEWTTVDRIIARRFACLLLLSHIYVCMSTCFKFNLHTPIYKKGNITTLPAFEHVKTTTLKTF